MGAFAIAQVVQSVAILKARGVTIPQPINLAQLQALVANTAHVTPSSLTPLTGSPSTAPPLNDPDAIRADQAISWLAANIGPLGKNSPIYQNWLAQTTAAIKAGVLNPGGQYATSSGKCAGASTPPGPNDVALAGQALGAAGTVTTAALTIASVSAPIPIIGAAIGAGALFLGLLAKLFGPPVSELEQKKLCPAVAAANAVLNQITAELQAGYISAAQAANALASLRASFNSAVSSILYIQTPNDTQLMLAQLDAIISKDNAITFPQLEAIAKATQASAAAASTASLNNQIAAVTESVLAAHGLGVIAPIASVPVASPPNYLWIGLGIAAVVLIAVAIGG